MVTGPQNGFVIMEVGRSECKSSCVHGKHVLFCSLFLYWIFIDFEQWFNWTLEFSTVLELCLLYPMKHGYPEMYHSEIIIKRLTGLFISDLFNFLPFPVPIVQLSYRGKKDPRVSLQYWFECGGKQESWVIGSKLTLMCKFKMTCKRWAISRDRKVWYCAHKSQGYRSTCAGTSLINFSLVGLVNMSVYVSPKL